MQPPSTTQPRGPRPHGVRWQRELAAAIRDPAELCAVLGLDERLAEEARAASGDFPLLVPRGFVARMRRGDPNDPLLRQVLPVGLERRPAAGFTADPLAERAAVTAPGLVRKYAGRVLLLAASGCAVNCRYCFRRTFPYDESGAGGPALEGAVAAVAADASIHEVILSGGDPLLLPDERLATLVAALGAVGHVKRLRIHTRLPVVLPSRIDDRLGRLLAATRLTTVVVIHANHAAELDDDVAAAMRRLAACRAMLLNQSVLLAGVNDSVAALAALSERLVEIGVVPYYLHLLDRVEGTSHHEVSEAEARRLHGALSARLPGYAVPRLVRELPGESAKVWLA